MKNLHLCRSISIHGLVKQWLFFEMGVVPVDAPIDAQTYAALYEKFLLHMQRPIFSVNEAAEHVVSYHIDENQVI